MTISPFHQCLAVEQPYFILDRCRTYANSTHIHTVIEPIVPQIATTSSPTMSSTSAEDVVIHSPGVVQSGSTKVALRLSSHEPVVCRDDTAHDSKTSVSLYCCSGGLNVLTVLCHEAYVSSCRVHQHLSTLEACHPQIMNYKVCIMRVHVHCMCTFSAVFWMSMDPPLQHYLPKNHTPYTI